ncbi:tryptophan synthase subunit alpha [Halonatronum saccharophilum]|uniref:tryptophan synthase subunit alpha n=1 Tax=Halonatronum saccharophilum TaxID=150060 RepID=UPI0004876D58|nr:tryptophan synthase subunit alpha [Halonatronum saccharophilum]
MGRIDSAFKRLKSEGQQAFIPFLMAGDPNLEMTKELVLEAQRRGADIIELGIPYSTPLADGPTIQRAAKRSLKNKTNLTAIFSLVEELREETQIPILLMGYYNLIFSYGLENFVKEAERVGVDGVIIPDLPLGEDQELRAYSNNLDIVLLVATNTTDRRLKAAAQNSSGFIYAVSTPGVTGAREDLSLEIKKVIDKLREYTGTPIAVGFGISKPEHVKDVHSFADGAIVGSAIIKKIEENLALLPDSEEEFIAKVGELIGELSGRDKG